MTFEAISDYFTDAVKGLLFSSGSTFSLTSLECALLVAAIALYLRVRSKKRKFGMGQFARLLFPSKMWTSASTRVDVMYLAFNVLAFGAMFGGAILSYKWLHGAMLAGLTTSFGAMPASTLPAPLLIAIATFIGFIAYELGYWLDHFLSHRIPVLWAFHKVHHTAEVLTPLTVWRVHPVEMLKFVNILAIVTAGANATTSWLFGQTLPPYTIEGANVLLIVFVHATLHLQHTSVWIPFTGVAGRILMSPAHHQLHHSMDPAHFNSNLGSCLSIFDSFFGTLCVPSKKPQKLHFGVAGEGAQAQSAKGAFVAPFTEAFAQIGPRPSPGQSVEA